MTPMNGTGTIGDPYIIMNDGHLNDVRDNMSASVYYQLGANIDLSSYPSWTPIGTTANEFKGHFDGNNFTISNMTITSLYQASIVQSIGLFGTIIIPTDVSQSYAIKNLTLQSCSINLNNWTIGTPTINNAKLYLGLLVGLWDDYSTHSGEDKSVWNRIESVKIKNSSINIIKSNLTGSVSESLSLIYLGGLIGGASYGLITSCSVDDIRIEGIISSSVASPAVYVGGLVNFYYQITYCTVKNSFINFECKVNSGSFDTHAPQMFMYAFAGAGTETEVHDNYVYNTVVSGALNVHGFSDTISVDENALFDLGHNFPSGKKYTNATFGNTPVSSVYLFTENYTELDASASLYNYVQSGSNIYNINDVTPTGMPTITELTVAQMKNSASYAGFDFQNVWNISPNSQSGYPYFGWETVDYTPPSKYATIEYSLDSGSTWNEITSSLPLQEGSGSYTWYAPETSSTQYIIRISSASVTDSSDAPFTVFGPYSMSGNIASGSGFILPSVTLTYSNGVSISFYDTLTGDFTSNIFTSSFTGTLIPTATNYIFNPVSRSYSSQTASLSGQDFEAIFTQSVESIYSISGSTMISGTNTPISGAKIVFESDRADRPITKYSNNNGIYSASFYARDSISWVATHPLYTMLPTSKIIADLTSSLNGQVFSGSIITYIVSGSITSASLGVSGIEVLCNFCTASLFTDANGQYSRSYATGSSIVLAPSSSLFIFSPTNRVVNNLSASSLNNDFIASSFIPPGQGLSLYYDSRKSYNDISNIWPDLSSELPDLNMNTYNTYYIDNKDLLFGAEWIGPASSSFYGIQVSSSFAIEMWIAPSTASGIKTVLSTEAEDYPRVIGYISQSKFVLKYKNNISETNITTVKSYNIAESKYNHIVLFSSASYLYAWSNGMCYESASITQSNWNGATLGINREFNTSSYEGFIDVVKVWNGIEINLPEITNYYVNKSYWKDFGSITIPSENPAWPDGTWYFMNTLIDTPQGSSTSGSNASGKLHDINNIPTDPPNYTEVVPKTLQGQGIPAHTAINGYKAWSSNNNIIVNTAWNVESDILAGLTDITFMIAFRHAPIDNYYEAHHLMFHYTTGSAHSIGCRLVKGTGKVYAHMDGTTVESTNRYDDSQIHIAVVVYNQSAKTLKFYLENGESFENVDAGFSSFSLSTDVVAQPTIGARSTSTVAHFGFFGLEEYPGTEIDPLFGDVLFFNSILTVSKINQIANWMADRIGITWTNI